MPNGFKPGPQVEEPERWLHCECGNPLYKFVGKKLPQQNTIIRSHDFEGVRHGDRAMECPECGSLNYFHIKNIHELAHA